MSPTPFVADRPPDHPLLFASGLPSPAPLTTSLLATPSEAPETYTNILSSTFPVLQIEYNRQSVGGVDAYVYVSLSPWPLSHLLFPLVSVSDILMNYIYIYLASC